MLGFDGAGTTRQNHTGIKKRIYRRRLFGNGILGHELSNKFYPIDEVAGNATVWVDDGSKTPDYSRPLRASHGYQTVRFFPRPDTRYEVVMRGVFLPEPMYNDTDVPRTTPDAGEALVCLGSSLLYEAQGEYTLANRAYEKYEKTLQRLRRRYGDLRPSGRVRRRRAARPRVRGTWNRELSGIVTDA